jgi:PAP2 superfamily
MSAARAWLFPFVAGIVAGFVLLPAREAHAADPNRVEWSPDWPRVRLLEGLGAVALTLGSYEMNANWKPRSEPTWRGGILFDDWVRRAVRGRTFSAQSVALDLSDYLLQGATLAPFVIDVYLVALSVHENAEVAAQMFLIDLQSFGLAGIASLSAENGVGRSRPYTQDCGPDGRVLDGSGHPLVNNCKTSSNTKSFWSGHTAAAATAAGLTCVHHQHLPLYGGGAADLSACFVMIGAAAATGVTRMVADAHWASDVIVAWGVGALSGYVLPSVLHYGFGRGRPIGEVKVGGARIVPVPQAYSGGAGFGFVGMY